MAKKESFGVRKSRKPGHEGRWIVVHRMPNGYLEASNASWPSKAKATEMAGFARRDLSIGGFHGYESGK